MSSTGRERSPSRRTATDPLIRTPRRRRADAQANPKPTPRSTPAPNPTPEPDPTPREPTGRERARPRRSRRSGHRRATGRSDRRHGLIPSRRDHGPSTRPRRHQQERSSPAVVGLAAFLAAVVGLGSLAPDQRRRRTPLAPAPGRQKPARHPRRTTGRTSGSTTTMRCRPGSVPSPTERAHCSRADASRSNRPIRHGSSRSKPPAGPPRPSTIARSPGRCASPSRRTRPSFSTSRATSASSSRRSSPATRSRSRTSRSHGYAS